MTISIELEIERGALLAYEIFGAASIGSKTSVPGGGVLELTDMLERKALDWPSLVSLSLDVTKDIGVGLPASWLYDKLSKRGHPRTIRIDRVEVTFDKGEIQRVLTERIEAQD